MHRDSRILRWSVGRLEATSAVDDTPVEVVDAHWRPRVIGRDDLTVTDVDVDVVDLPAARFVVEDQVSRLEMMTTDWLRDLRIAGSRQPRDVISGLLEREVHEPGAVKIIRTRCAPLVH